MNVYVPANPAVGAKPQSLPVYVYIYGGGFLNGAAEANPGTNFVRANKGVIVVTISYRLGMWGFFAHPALSSEQPTGEIERSGNWGIEDQRAALEWVQANIGAFGGDKTQVTLGGESAGSISVCTHIFSARSAGLFQRAILESGGCDNAARSVRDAEQIGVKITSAFGALYQQFGLGNAGQACTGVNGTAAQLVCLRATPNTILNLAANAAGSFAYFGATALIPSVDGYNLVDFPQNLMASGKMNKVSLLIGSNGAEMGLFIAPISEPAGSGGQFQAPSAEAVDYYANYFSGGNAGIVAYYNTTNSVPARFPTDTVAMQSLLSKNLFQCPPTRLARSMASLGQTVYSYIFNYSSQFDNLAQESEVVGGAMHGTELVYVFGLTDNYNDDSADPTTLGQFPNAADNATSASMRTYWTKFIATGDVNAALALPGLRGPSTVNAPSWTKLTPATEDALRFAPDGSIAMVQNVYTAECAQWDALVTTRTSFQPQCVGGECNGSSSSSSSSTGISSSSTGINSASTAGPNGLIMIAIAAFATLTTLLKL